LSEYEPESWKKHNANNYDVGEYQVQFHKGKWTCDCLGDTFRLGGRKQKPCKHVNFVKNKEEEI